MELTEVDVNMLINEDSNKELAPQLSVQTTFVELCNPDLKADLQLQHPQTNKSYFGSLIPTSERLFP